jgi:hypothetical protein
MARIRDAITLAAIAGVCLSCSKPTKSNSLNAATISCSAQGVQPGTYYIISQLNSDEPCLDKDTNDGKRIQFYFCNGAARVKSSN